VSQTHPMLSRWIGYSCATIFMALLACQSPERESATMIGAAAQPTSAFDLITIGGRPILSRSETVADCGDRPYYSQYVLSGQQWSGTDSAYTGCGPDGVSHGPIARRDSGSFRLVVDTVSFYSADTTVGVHGLVLRGRLAGDSLVLWGSDYDGGDHVYVRRATPARD
jgi:hypothetical protein